MRGYHLPDGAQERPRIERARNDRALQLLGKTSRSFRRVAVYGLDRDPRTFGCGAIGPDGQRMGRLSDWTRGLSRAPLEEADSFLTGRRSRTGAGQERGNYSCCLHVHGRGFVVLAVPWRKVRPSGDLPS